MSSRVMVSRARPVASTRASLVRASLVRTPAFFGPPFAFEKTEVPEGLAREAGDLAGEHALRGFEAIHLASALLVSDAYSEQGDEAAEETVLFLGFDSNLSKAAGKVMRVYEEANEKPNGQSLS